MSRAAQIDADELQAWIVRQEWVEVEPGYWELIDGSNFHREDWPEIEAGAEPEWWNIGNGREPIPDHGRDLFRSR